MTLVCSPFCLSCLLHVAVVLFPLYEDTVVYCICLIMGRYEFFPIPEYCCEHSCLCILIYACIDFSRHIVVRGHKECIISTNVILISKIVQLTISKFSNLPLVF